MSAIDPNFNGRVSLHLLSRAVCSAQGVQRDRAKESAERKQQHQTKISTTYSESLPVDVVKVDWQARSLCDFERAVANFRKQQRDLLASHHELPH